MDNGLSRCLSKRGHVVFVAMRTGARWFKLRRMPLQMEDILIYGALVSFAITTALYLATVPTFFNVEAIEQGRMEPYAGLQDDLVLMLHEFFVVQFFFWLTLWMVKWSLMCMFKKLTDGLPLYNRIWWGVLVFSILTFIGCCISNFTSCSSMHAWFTAGECSTPRDARAKNISLWFSLAVDLATDLLIMAVPMRVLWGLQMSLVEKISIGVVFAVGLITMVTAIIRSVTLESSSTSGQVSTTWLIMWAAIEGAIAMIVGCLPSFAVFIHGRVAASRAQYASGSNKNPAGPRTKSHGTTGSNRLWQYHDASSDKSLVGGGIVVTQSWRQSWHNTAGPKTERVEGLETDHELEIVGGNKDNGK
ncbi:hypothetical protein N5P37_009177 [Trichoderma harzianum]|nr:hypothetical protein N5P37_009177 [Trichoderma harzianum]